MTEQEKINCIGALTQTLAYVQEYTVTGKLDDKDLASPIVPKYSIKQRVIDGDLRSLVEKKLKAIVSSLGSSFPIKPVVEAE